jgi:histone H3/H4
MIKSKEKTNLLIKKNLKKFLKKQGFSRVGPKALDGICNFIGEQLEILSKRAKQEMIIQGKKVLDKRVIEEIFRS